MKILKFEGATMRDALAKVKAELGDQAVVVATRQIRRGLLGTACEISAAIDDGEDEAPQKTRGWGPLIGPTMGGPITTPPQAAPAVPVVEEVEKMIAPLRSELRSLRALIRSASDHRGTTELRQELASLRKLVEGLHTPPPVATAIRATTPMHDGPLTGPSTGRIIMLVGPTGAGKTTTIAKLAARAALIEGKRVAMITLDNYRVGGIDQIRTFAELIGVPLRIAANPAALADLIDDSDELTLIDTAGRSPRDLASVAELADALGQLPPIEVHLVVPAASSAASIDDLAKRYQLLQPSRLLVTKLDEQDETPELALAPARLGLPITWVTTGQAVPEDIEEPTSARLLELAAAGLHGKTKNRNRAA
jgi:flagellar biosynthesis protein FlhF